MYEFLNIFFDESDGQAEYTEHVSGNAAAETRPATGTSSANDSWIDDLADRTFGVANMDAPGEADSPTESKAATETTTTSSVDEKAKTAETALPEGVTPEMVKFAQAVDAEAKLKGFKSPDEYLQAQIAERSQESARLQAEVAEQRWTEATQSRILKEYQAKVDAGELDEETATELMNRDWQLARQGRILQDKEVQAKQSQVAFEVQRAVAANPMLSLNGGEAASLVHHLALSGLVKDVPTAAGIVNSIIKSVGEKAVADYIAKQESNRKEAKVVQSSGAANAPSADRNQTKNSDWGDDLFASIGRWTNRAKA